MARPLRGRRPLLLLLLAAWPALAAAAAPEGQRSRRANAICVCGGLVRFPPEEALWRLRRVAEERLDAEVFLVLWHGLPGVGRAGRRKAASAASGALRLLDWVSTWVSKIMWVPPEERTLRSLAAEYALANPGNRSGDLLEQYARDLPGGYLQPLVGGYGFSHAAFAWQDLQRCLVAFRAAEAERRAPFGYLAFARLDLYWVAMPPPISLMEAANSTAVWVPDGMDYAGLNDRFAVVPRRWADAYFGLLARLLNGSLIEGLYWLSRGLSVDPGHWRARRVSRWHRGTEWGLNMVLKILGVPIARFAPVGAVLCSGVRGASGYCTDDDEHGTPPFKYVAEADEAVLNAQLLQRGWVWRALTRGPKIKPPCFATEAEQSRCCSTHRMGVNGNYTCWWDVQNFERCCPGERQTGLWILPGPREAAERLESLTVELGDGADDEMCWEVSQGDFEPAPPWKRHGFRTGPASMCVGLRALAAPRGHLAGALRPAPRVGGGVLAPVARNPVAVVQQVEVGNDVGRVICVTMGGEGSCQQQFLTRTHSGLEALQDGKTR